MSRRRAIAATLAAVALLTLSGLATARPGAGHTFSGGSSSNSSSSSSSSSGSSYGSGRSGSSSSGSSVGSGGGVADLDPRFALFLFVGLVAIFGANLALKLSPGLRQWDAGRTSTAPIPSEPDDEQAPDRPPREALRSDLDALRMLDPGFSLVPFEDFLYALYAAVHEARGGSKLYDLKSYLLAQPTRILEEMACADVSGVVIGSMTYERVGRRRSGGKRWVEIRVCFESNYTETDEAQDRQTYYAREHWTLRRNRDAKSKPPEKARVIGCPSCGGPLAKSQGNVCSYCGETIAAAEFDWAVAHIDVEQRSERPPQLTSDAPEVGTDEPTIVAPGAKGRFRAMRRDDPSVSWRGIRRRVGVVFRSLQRGWSTQRWKLVRPYVSDSLFQMQLYWIDTYKRAGLRNLTERSRITRLELADARSDRFYDSITVRLHARGLDYTIDETGALVSGSRVKKRAYSEYWTLIRGRGTERSSSPSQDKGCPSCGAPLAINMAGGCKHCDARITSGQFDWVLSRIEQDEAYRG